MISKPDGLPVADLEGITVIKELIGEAMKILNMKYNPKIFAFEVECIMPGQTVPGVYVFDKKYFPNHAPVPLLDEMVQVGEAVHVWIKEEELLKSEGWKDLTKHTLASPDSPFKIGKGKKIYLGGAHKGTVCLNEKFQPFVAIKGYRFSANEIKCVLRLDNMFAGKNAEISNPQGKWTFSADKQLLVTPKFKLQGMEDINGLIDLMRRARLI